MAGTTFFPRRFERVGGAWAPRPGFEALRWESPGTLRRSGRDSAAPEQPSPPPSCVRDDVR
jgi:hypothetical protein